MPETYRYNEDKSIIDDMGYAFSNYMAGEYDAPQWQRFLEANKDLFDELEGAVNDGCGDNGKPFPEDLCRRWADRFGLGPASPDALGFDKDSLEALRRNMIISYLADMAGGRMPYEEGGRKATKVYSASYRQLLDFAEEEDVAVSGYRYMAKIRRDRDGAGE